MPSASSVHGSLQKDEAADGTPHLGLARMSARQSEFLNHLVAIPLTHVLKFASSLLEAAVVCPVTYQEMGSVDLDT